MHKVYEFPKSREAFAHACEVIPSGIYGHQGPAEGCYIPIEAFPLYSQKAQGSYLWDLDGNRFIDYMCAYGPNILGYNDPDVDEAAAKQRAISDCTTLPNPIMIDFADLLVDTVASADWAFFAKNGNDATSGAVMCARAHTHRKKIVFFKGYYHGVSPWTQKIDYAGVLPEDVENNIYVDWNDYDQLAQAFEDNKDEIAAVIAQPYMHGNFADNTFPAKDFWAKVRKLCDNAGTVLIVDDVRAGFRMDLAGSDHYFGFEADLICFCKALANGYNVSAICGKKHMMNAMSSLAFTGSYWMSAVPFAAGIACIEKMKRINCPEILIAKGQKLKDGLLETAKKYDYDLHVTGIPSLFYLRIADDPSLLLHQEWVAECVQRGIFITNHHTHFITASLSDEDSKETIETVDEAFSIIQERHS